MNDKTITSIVGVLLAVIGVAAVAVLVSKNAQTGNIFGAFGTSFSNILCKALSPVTGSSCGGGIPSVNSTITFG